MVGVGNGGRGGCLREGNVEHAISVNQRLCQQLSSLNQEENGKLTAETQAHLTG
jgi:hypothetical protein